MDRIILVAIAAVAAMSLLGFLVDNLGITGLFVGFRQPNATYEWWNTSWTYRFQIDVSTGFFERTNWPIEREVNFTDLLPSGTFNNNSIRVIEYNSSGDVVREVTSQFDRAPTYNNLTNALGTLTFIMNGSTPAGANRTFFVYYDVAEHGAKQNPNYPTSLRYDLDGEEFLVNNTIFHFRADTLRGDRTSGLYRVRGLASASDLLPFPLGANEKTFEYIEYSNGTHNFSFNFASSASTAASGPVKIVVEQVGDEVLWNTTTSTGTAVGTKRYTFYNNMGWVRVETNYTNIGLNPITRNSTFAGAIKVDAQRAFGSGWQSGFGNTTPPGWWFASDQFSSFHWGVIHVNQSGTSSYWVPNSSGDVVIGVRLNDTTIASGSSIIESAVFDFNETSGDLTQVRGLRDRLASPVNVTQHLPEELTVSIQPSANATIVNRNETVLIRGDVLLGDPFNATQFMNATLDYGVGFSVANATIQLGDAGAGGDVTASDRIFSGQFAINNTAQVGFWRVNVTAYSISFSQLNTTNFTFNVTDVLNVTINITNDRPIAGVMVFANFKVQNFRRDAGISGAGIGCRYEGPSSQDITNVTDAGAGNYSLNFTAPASQGAYTVTCNATKNGNFGQSTDSFEVEPTTTAARASPVPALPLVDNMTEPFSDTVDFVANTTTIGVGTAYAANVTLGLYTGWSANSTFEQCGNILPGGFCLRGFQVTVPGNTTSGNYTINFTVNFRNPDNSTDSNVTQFNVFVEQNPFMNVTDTLVSASVGDGGWNILGNFTIDSIGNTDLQNVVFNCTSGPACTNSSTTFVPDPVTIVPLFQTQSVQINITPTVGILPGTYNGTINASSATSNYDLFDISFTVPPNTDVSVNSSIGNYTANLITLNNNETFNFTANATNLILASARFANVTVKMPSGWVANSTTQQCGSIVVKQPCLRGFGVTIPAGTLAGSYVVNLTANWTNADGSFETNTSGNIIVNVTSGPAINILESSISGVIADGATQDVGNFTIQSIGNAALQNITVSCASGAVCTGMSVNFNTTFISSLSVGSTAGVNVDVTVPVGFAAGLHSGTVSASAQNDGFDTLSLQVNVSENRTWSMSPTLCQKSLEITNGTACDVTVTNGGNIAINFTVTPTTGNLTEVNETSFVVNGSGSKVFRVTYNATGQPQAFYNTTFLVDANQSNSNPTSRNLVITLIPFIPPVINVTITPNITEQNSTILIRANVTDQSSTGINFARVNVTRPNGTVVDTLTMSLLSTSGNLTRWEVTYPNGTNGSTLDIGTYNVTVFALDNINDFGNATTSFKITKKLSVTLSTLSSTYFQGDQGSIFYVARDLSGDPIENVTVNFTIRDGFGNITYLSGNLQTNSDGTIVPFPTFQLPSDAIVSNYTLTAKSRDFDNITNQTLEVQTNFTFSVLPDTVSVSGLFADVETSVAWYPNNVMKFGILTYNGEGLPVTPDTMNMTVFDPAGSVYLTTTMASMTQQGTGLFIFQFAMPQSTPTGMFLAVLDATKDGLQTRTIKAFRVSAGGPFDLRLFLFENEVPAGTNLDYSVNVENKGEVSQDVFIDYWVSQNNVTYAQFSEAVFSPSLSNQTFSRQIFLFSNLVPGTYLLNARMIFNDQQPQIVVNKSFLIISGTNVTPPSTSAGGTTTEPSITTAQVTVPATAKIPADLIIEKYTSNITLARGFSKIETVIVTNIGTTELGNVSLFLTGINPDWYEITPASYRSLAVDNSSIFLITFELPDNAAVGEYPATLLATSGVVSDQKRIVLTVVDSLYRMLEIDIRNLENDLRDLEVDARVAQIQGKDVTPVMILIEQIKEQIDLAKDNLNRGRLQLVPENIKNARNLIDKARDILDQLQIQEIVFVVPYEIIFIILAVIGGVFVVLFVLWKKNKLPTGIRSHMLPLIKAIEKVKIRKAASISPSSMLADRIKLTRMLDMLERERNERIISLGAYTEMRKSIQKKLDDLEKKIRK